MSGGRPTKYDPKYCKMLIDYFKAKPTGSGKNKEAPELPQFIWFAESIGVSRETLHEWRRKHPEFSDAYNTATKLQEAVIADNAMKNRYNPYFAQFMLKNNHGWKDKTDIEFNDVSQKSTEELRKEVAQLIGAKLED